MKTFKKGQISVGTIFGAIGVFGAAIYFVWGQFSNVDVIDTKQTADIAVLGKVAGDSPEIRNGVD